MTKFMSQATTSTFLRHFRQVDEREDQQTTHYDDSRPSMKRTVARSQFGACHSRDMRTICTLSIQQRHLVNTVQLCGG